VSPDVCARTEQAFAAGHFRPLASLSVCGGRGWVGGVEVVLCSIVWGAKRLVLSTFVCCFCFFWFAVCVANARCLLPSIWCLVPGAQAPPPPPPPRLPPGRAAYPGAVWPQSSSRPPQLTSSEPLWCVSRDVHRVLQALPRIPCAHCHCVSRLGLYSPDWARCLYVFCLGATVYCRRAGAALWL
jgi:hypothetical protein